MRWYSDQNLNNLIHDLEQTEWNLILNNGDVEICNEDYYNHIDRLLNQHFPHARLSRNDQKIRRMDCEIVKAVC